jgi:hypothetical protein
LEKRPGKTSPDSAFSFDSSPPASTWKNLPTHRFTSRLSPEVATGFVSHWAVGNTLQDWARVLLATGMIDLTYLEDHPDGEVLLEAVWDAAAAASDIDSQRIEVVQRLAESA